MEPVRKRGARRLVLAGAVLGLVAAGGFGLVIVLGVAPPARGIGLLPFPLLWATPAVLALLALGERPVLLLPAAALGFLTSFTGLSGVTLVLLIPTLFYMVAHHVLAYRPVTVTRPLLAILLPVVAGAGAFSITLAGSDSVCWTYVEEISGDRTYAEVGCNEDGEVAPVLWSGPATTLRPPALSGPPANSSRPGSSRPDSSGSQLVPPPGTPSGLDPASVIVASGGGATSTTSPLAAAAAAVLLLAGVAAAWILSGSGGGNGGIPAPF